MGSKGFGERFGVVSSDTRSNLLQEAKALHVGEREQAVLEHVRRPAPNNRVHVCLSNASEVMCSNAMASGRSKPWKAMTPHFVPAAAVSVDFDSTCREKHVF